MNAFADADLLLFGNEPKNIALMLRINTIYQTYLTAFYQYIGLEQNIKTFDIPSLCKTKI